MFFRVFLVILFFSPPAFSKIEWSLQITDPQFELKNIPLPDREYRPFLPKTSWRCRFGSTQKKMLDKKGESKTVSCNYSIKKAGEFTTYISCSPSHPYGESKFDLFDQRKRILFKLLVLCRYRQ